MSAYSEGDKDRRLPPAWALLLLLATRMPLQCQRVYLVFLGTVPKVSPQFFTQVAECWSNSDFFNPADKRPFGYIYIYLSEYIYIYTYVYTHIRVWNLKALCDCMLSVVAGSASNWRSGQSPSKGWELSRNS